MPVIGFELKILNLWRRKSLTWIYYYWELEMSFCKRIYSVAFAHDSARVYVDFRGKEKHTSFLKKFKIMETFNTISLELMKRLVPKE